MMPLPRRWLTALMTRYNGSSLLIDCGEGTQVAIKEKGWSFKPIDVICFTHYHGDHISGLPGLLLSMGNAERHEPLTLICPKWLEFVVEQILSNAIKYSGENHAVTIHINRNEADNTCELVISDQGIGIRKEDLPRIFEKGYTGYNGRADKTSTGIGLYLCREITKKLGHGIMITSEIGIGSDVTIVFVRNNLDVRD